MVRATFVVTMALIANMGFAQGPGGYQLKYKRMPSKTEKKSDPAADAAKRSLDANKQAPKPKPAVNSVRSPSRSVPSATVVQPQSQPPSVKPKDWRWWTWEERIQYEESMASIRGITRKPVDQTGWTEKEKEESATSSAKLEEDWSNGIANSIRERRQKAEAEWRAAAAMQQARQQSIADAYELSRAAAWGAYDAELELRRQTIDYIRAPYVPMIYPPIIVTGPNGRYQ